MLGRPPDSELRRVYRDHLHAVYAFLAYRVSRDTAEDLTQATFERVIRHWKRYDPSLASERTWVLAIAKNILTDHFRRQSHRTTVSTDEHPAILDALVERHDPLASAIARSGLRDWLAQLRPREQEVVALRFGAELSAREIADLCDLTEANVHQISSRALKRLRAFAADAADADAAPDVSGSAARRG